MHYLKLVLLAAIGMTAGTLKAQQRKEIKRADTARLLEEVAVQGKYQRNYSPKELSASLKLNTPLQQLPQNIAVINSTTMADQAMLNVTEGLQRNVSGVTRSTVSNFFGPAINMRGNALVTLRNGMDVTQPRGPIPEDAAVIERVEIVKGAAGFLGSVGDAAGSYNVVTKEADGLRRMQLSGATGSYKLYRLAADAGGALIANKLNYRMNAVGSTAGGFTKYGYSKRRLLAPALQYIINPVLTLNAEYTYQRLQFKQFSPTVFSPRGYGSMPVDFTITDPNIEPYNTREHTAQATLRYKAGERWQLVMKAGTLNSNIRGSYLFVTSPYVKNSNVLIRSYTGEEYFTNSFAGQMYATGEEITGRVKHKLLVSADYVSKYMLQYGGWQDPDRDKTDYILDLDNPQYGIEIKKPMVWGRLQDYYNFKQNIWYGALYAQDEMVLDGERLRLTVGMRANHAQMYSETLKKGAAADNNVLLPRAGLNYRLIPGFNVYGLYDNTFLPQAGSDKNGGAFKPLYGRNYELGVKKEWFGGRFSSDISVYTIKRRNLLVTDTENTQYRAQTGTSRSRGIEVDVRGRLAAGLHIICNYAFNDSKIMDDTSPLRRGSKLPFTARNTQNNWISYTLPIQGLKGLSLYYGTQWQGGRASRYPDDAGQPDLANYFRMDAGVGYSGRQFSMQLMVNNVENRRLYGSAWARPAGYYVYVPEEPRALRLTAAYNL